MELDDPVPLPIGLAVPQNTVFASPLIHLQGKNIIVHDETDSGWPTVITMDLEDSQVGIAVDYLGKWHSQDVGMEEVDLLLSYQNEEWVWRAIVAFSTKSDALDRGRYQIDRYNGCELIPWSTENLYEKMVELLDEKVTPIAYTEDHPYTKDQPTYRAYALQKADNIGTLNRMFGLNKLDTLQERRERLFTNIVPREVRWRDRDTSMQDLARKFDPRENDEK